jgi:hypothetical protein
MTDLPNTPSGLMRLMPSTASQIQSFANGIVQSVRNGNEDPLDVLLQVRAMEKALKIILDNVKPFAEREAEKYPGNKFEFRGNEFAKCDVKTEYDYTTSKDPIYERRLYEFEKAQKELKEREAFLKAIKEPITLVDDLTGEVVEVRAPLKKTVSGLKITIK